MSLNLGGARDTFAAALMPYTASVTRGVTTLTSACGVAVRGAGEERDAADVERAGYRLTLPGRSALVLLAGEVVTVTGPGYPASGRRFRVVAAPARSSLNLTDAYVVTEVR